jgi:hypothetical protein
MIAFLQMNRRQCLSALMMVVLVCGNAAMVQAVAWASMLLDRVQRMDVAAAVTSTFDGSAPCEMCRAADAFRDERTPSAPADAVKQLKHVDAQPPTRTVEPGCAGWMMIGRQRLRMDRPTPYRVAPEPPPPRWLG